MSKLKGTLNKDIAARVNSFDVTTESLTIARHLRLEGYYAKSTRLSDIARRVESLRVGKKKAMAQDL